MTTAQADVAVLRPAEHAAELAAQHTIGTAYDPFRHFSRTLLPRFYFSGARIGVDDDRRFAGEEAWNVFRSNSIAP
jgi:hypothetical protein